MFKNINIRTRLLFGFLFIALLIGITGYIAIRGSQQINQSLEIATTSTLPSIQALLEISNITADIQRQTLGFQLLDTTSAREAGTIIGEYKFELIATVDKLNERIDKFERFSLPGQAESELDVADKILEGQKALINVSFDYLELVETGATEPVLTEKKGELAAAQQTLNEAVAQAIESELAAIQLQNDSSVTTAQRVVWFSIVISMAAFLLALLFGFIFAHFIATPINRLTDAVGEFGDVATIDLATERSLENIDYESYFQTPGNAMQEIAATRQDEVGTLAAAFQAMVTQIRTLVSGLQSRLLALEISTKTSNQLATILDVDELLKQVVVTIQETFDYYHVHIYLVNAAADELVMVEGTGEVGQQLKAKGHTIPFGRGIVGSVARTGQATFVENVAKLPDFIANPLLPKTRSEMAIPLRKGDQILGVLDMQSEEIGGFTADDLTLMQSIADQVAISVDNAQLFAQVETRLADLQVAQDRYIEQAWTKANLRHQEYRYNRPNTPVLDETTVLTARQLAQVQNRPALVALNSDKSNAQTVNHKPQSIVSPIILNGKIIGDLQMHQAEEDKPSPWTDNDLALLEAILDQVAQTAENLRLFDETRQQAGRQKLLADVGDRLRRANDMESLMKLGIEEVSRVLGAKQAFVRLGSEAELLEAQPAVIAPSNGHESAPTNGAPQAEVEIDQEVEEE